MLEPMSNGTDITHHRENWGSENGVGKNCLGWGEKRRGKGEGDGGAGCKQSDGRDMCTAGHEMPCCDQRALKMAVDGDVHA